MVVCMQTGAGSSVFGNSDVGPTSPATPGSNRHHQHLPQRRHMSSAPSRLPARGAKAAALTRARRKRAWDACTLPPSEVSFEDALRAWSRDVESGAYTPQVLRPLSPMGGGNGVTVQKKTGGCMPTIRAGAAEWGGAGLAAPLQQTVIVFTGTEGLALEALESLVWKQLVTRPHLTLLQLERGVTALSELDTPAQLAAVALLLRGGFWVAAMQVAYADFGLLAAVLQEMRGLLVASNGGTMADGDDDGNADGGDDDEVSIC